MLDGFSDGGPVSLPSSLVSQWTSGFKNKIYDGYFSSIYTGLILPSEGSGEGQRVAVKKLNKAIALEDDAKVIQLSTREQDEATSFHHANIIRLVGYYLPPCGNLSESEQSMKEPCLVYEYAPCGGLNTILKDNDKAAKLNWHSRLNIAIGVAKGLHYMHSSIADCPAYHRDMKSSHIALMADYTPRIIDYRPHTMYCPWGWGDSTVSDHFDTCDRPGTFEYMCPDYRSGEVIKYDATCEVYSFGIVLLELLTGQLHGCMDENGYKVMLEAVYLDTQAPKVDDRVQWPADLVDDFLALARQCIAPYQRRIRSMTTVLHRLEAMSNKHYTTSTIEIGLMEQNNLLLSRLAALELRADIQAMQAVETTYKCMSCLDDDIPASKGSVCSNRTFPHFYCGVERNNCLGNMLLSQSNDITHFKRNSCQILCACCVALSPRVVSTFDVSVIARQSNRETLDTYIRTITDAERHQGAMATEKLRSEHVIEIQMLNEAYSTGKASRLKGMTERHRLHIINNIMTLLCPHCKMAIFDFVNCFAVKHESDDSHLKYGCGLYFCGWCLAKCESSGDCHSHVRKCRHSMNPGNAYGNFPVDFDAAHAKRRKELIRRYLQVGISDPQDRKKVHLAIQKELNELGVNIGNPDS